MSFSCGKHRENHKGQPFQQPFTTEKKNTKTHSRIRCRCGKQCFLCVWESKPLLFPRTYTPHLLNHCFHNTQMWEVLDERKWETHTHSNPNMRRKGGRTELKCCVGVLSYQSPVLHLHYLLIKPRWIVSSKMFLSKSKSPTQTDIRPVQRRQHVRVQERNLRLEARARLVWRCQWRHVWA